jgi:GT2 family glycosyltransferase
MGIPQSAAGAIRGGPGRPSINDHIKEQDNDWSRYEALWGERSGDPLWGEVAAAPNRGRFHLTKSVSVIIPAWNAEATIGGCLAAIEHSTLHQVAPQLLQVVVIDDGLTDRTWEILRGYRGSLHLLALRQPWLGQTPAINTGLAYAEGELIIFCDADMLLNVWALEELTLRHQALDNIVCVGFRRDMEPESATDVLPQHTDDDSSFRRHLFALDNRFHFEELGWPENMFVESDGFKTLGHGRKLWMSCDEFWDLPRMVYGCLFSIAAADLCLFGGFDERLQGWGFSDSLIGAKARALGRLILPVISASGWHVSHPYRSAMQPIEGMRNLQRYSEILDEPLAIPDALPSGARCRATTWHEWPGAFSSCERGYRPELAKTSARERARTLVALGQYLDAAEAWRACGPGEEAVVEQARSLRMGGRPVAAVQFLAEQSRGSRCARMAIEQALSQAAVGYFDKARVQMEEALALDPREPLCHYILNTPIEWLLTRAQFYQVQGNHTLSRRDCETVLMRDPSHKEARAIFEQLC